MTILEAMHDPNLAVGKEGKTALGMAKRNGSYDIGEILKAAGAK